MPQQITLTLTPRQAADAKFYTAQAARRMGIRESDIALARVVKRSIDARQRQVKVNLTLEIYADREPQPGPVHFDYPSVEGRTEYSSWVMAFTATSRPMAVRICAATSCSFS